LDRGGPADREGQAAHYPDFLFPQMTDERWAPEDWRPSLVDYLYVSLTNATAFSPTDTMPLTSPAKWLMSAQAVTSLATIGLVEVPHAPPSISAAMRIADLRAARPALGAAAAAGVKHMAHRFIVGESPSGAARVLRGLWERGVASSVDLLGEATVTQAEADAY